MESICEGEVFPSMDKIMILQRDMMFYSGFEWLRQHCKIGFKSFPTTMSVTMKAFVRVILLFSMGRSLIQRVPMKSPFKIQTDVIALPGWS
ncbi:MAG: hypothetical protein R2769_16475 [Saprospiraceae bacterium]